MGMINIEGLGQIEIAGDKPTKDEAQQIQKLLKSPETKNRQMETDIKETNGLSMGRLAIEVGFGVAGSLLTGGLALPAALARIGALSSRMIPALLSSANRPTLALLGKTTLGEAAGTSLGAGVSQFVDPKENIAQEMARGFAEGTIAGGILQPATIKGMYKISGSMRKNLDLIEAAKAAEDTVTNFAQKIAGATGVEAERYAKRAAELGYKNYLEDARKLVDEPFTPGRGIDSKGLNIIQGMVEKSFFSGGLDAKVKSLKSLTTFQTEIMADDYVREFLESGVFSKQEVGTLFIDSIGGSKQAFQESQNLIANGLRERYAKYVAAQTQLPISGAGVVDVNDVFFKNTLVDVGSMEPYLKKLLLKSDIASPSLNSASSKLIRDTLDKIRSPGYGPNSPKGMLRYDDFMDLVANVNKLKASAYDKTAGEGLKEYKQMIGKVSDGYRKTLRNSNLPNDLKKGFDDFMAYSSGGYEGFDNAVVQKLITQFDDTLKNSGDELFTGSADSAFNAIFSGEAKDGVAAKLMTFINRPRTESIIRLGNKDVSFFTGFEKLQKERLTNAVKASLVKSLMSSAKKPGGKVTEFGLEVNAKTFADNILEYKGVINAVFKDDKVGRKSLEDLATALQAGQAKIAPEGGSTTGSIFIQMQQAGAINQVGGLIFAGGLLGVVPVGAVAASAGVLLALPALTGRVLSSPKMMKFLRQSVDSYTDDLAAGKFTSKTRTILRQTINQAFADGLISDGERKNKFIQIDRLEKEMDKAKTKNLKEKLKFNEDIKDKLEGRPKRRPDPLDEALDSIGPMSSAPAPTPQPQGQAPQAQGSGIASLGNQSGGNQSDQLARMEQVGLPLFRG